MLKPHELLAPSPSFDVDLRMIPTIASQPLSDVLRANAPGAENMNVPNAGYYLFEDPGLGEVHFEMPTADTTAGGGVAVYGVSSSMYPDASLEMCGSAGQFPLYQTMHAPQARPDNRHEGPQSSPFFQSPDIIHSTTQLRSSFFTIQPQDFGASHHHQRHHHHHHHNHASRPAAPRGGVAPALARSITNIRLARERATRLARNEARDVKRSSRDKGIPSVLEGWLDPAAAAAGSDTTATMMMMQKMKDDETETENDMSAYIMSDASLSWEYSMRD